jgi:hypothetical protein
MQSLIVTLRKFGHASRTEQELKVLGFCVGDETLCVVGCGKLSAIPIQCISTSTGDLWIWLCGFLAPSAVYIMVYAS